VSSGTAKGEPARSDVQIGFERRVGEGAPKVGGRLLGRENGPTRLHDHPGTSRCHGRFHIVDTRRELCP